MLTKIMSYKLHISENAVCPNLELHPEPHLAQSQNETKATHGPGKTMMIRCFDSRGRER